MVGAVLLKHIRAKLLIVKVAHGHLLRAFAKRWLKYPLETPLSMMLEPGAIGILRFGRFLLEKLCVNFGPAINITVSRNRRFCLAWGFQRNENQNRPCAPDLPWMMVLPATEIRTSSSSLVHLIFLHRLQTDRGTTFESADMRAQFPSRLQTSPYQPNQSLQHYLYRARLVEI